MDWDAGMFMPVRMPKQTWKRRVDSDKTARKKKTQEITRERVLVVDGRCFFGGVVFVFPYVPHICDRWYLRVFLDRSWLFFSFFLLLL
jgi:hypothetical protein